MAPPTTTTQQLPKWEIPPVFYVGGEYVRDKEGTHMSGQIADGEVPPDGRPGLALLQAQQGWNCYVVDLVGVGRSRYHSGDMGPLKHYTAEELQSAFTAPVADAWPTAKLHTQWPGSGMMGDTDFDTFYASQVGHNTNYKIMEPMLRKAARSLLTKTGPAYLVTHSQSGPLGWHIADECPDLVRGIVTLEPHGPPFEYPDAAPFNKQLQLVGTLLHPFGITSTPLHFSPSLDAGATQLSYERSTIPENNGLVSGCRQKRPPRQLVNLASIPVLLVTAEASYHASYDHLMADFLRDAGVPVEHVYLAEKGIRGNGHLMAIEANNDEIQRFINEWLIQTEGLRSRN